MTVRVVMSTHMLGLLPEIVYLCNSLWFIGVLQVTVMCYSISGMNSELEWLVLQVVTWWASFLPNALWLSVVWLWGMRRILNVVWLIVVVPQEILLNGWQDVFAKFTKLISNWQTFVVDCALNMIVKHGLIDQPILLSHHFGRPSSDAGTWSFLFLAQCREHLYPQQCVYWGMILVTSVHSTLTPKSVLLFFLSWGGGGAKWGSANCVLVLVPLSCFSEISHTGW